MKTTGKVVGLVSNLVTVEVNGPVAQNEICFVILDDGSELMAEVIKIEGILVDVQVYESTRGLKIGDQVRFEQHMLEVTLGPGLLSKNFDGLQNDLDKMTGLFLKRGEYTDPLDRDKKWDYEPTAKVGDTVEAGSWIGLVEENHQPHRIMVPFTFKGMYTVKKLTQKGQYTVDDEMAVLTDESGVDHSITMTQKWPVRQAVPCYADLSLIHI